MEKLRGEVCYATNRINLIYGDTDWRPTYYVRVETPNADDEHDFWSDCRVHLRAGIECRFPKSFRNTLNGWDNLRYFESCRYWKYHYYQSKLQRHIKGSWHLPRICDFGTAVTAAVQLAVIDGYDVLYLVGCDLGYKEGGDNHFYNSSGEKRQPADQANANMILAHKIAKRSSPIPIYNATIGGSLEVYPRVSLKDLL